VFGRATETAIAALGSLAETHDAQERRSVGQIATSCGLRRPFLAKLLAVLSRAGMVQGERGPGGGYRLARDPEEITLLEVYGLFEGELPRDDCAWGSDCLTGDPCALHDGVVEVRETTRRFLEETTLAAFRRSRTPRAKNAGRPPGGPERSAGKTRAVRKKTRKKK
jgi:Rrf2 family iron-sulfur cluster assembly transcriptional regulator